MNLPNKLTILRIALVPLMIIAYFLPFVLDADDSVKAFLPFVACAIFLLACLTDFLDGFIARKYNIVTDFGKLLDPIADKVLVTATLFCTVATNVFANNPSCDPRQLSFVIAPENHYAELIFIACCATLILARELLISGVRMIAASKGKVVQANIFGKIKTVLQDIALPLMILLNAWQWVSYTDFNLTVYSVIYCVGLVTFILATVMTVVSGVIYCIQNKKVFKND